MYGGVDVVVVVVAVAVVGDGVLADDVSAVIAINRMWC